MIVVDAGAWVTALIDDSPKGDAARRILTHDPEWVAPAHAPVEALRTVRRYETSGLITAAQASTYAAEVRAAEIRWTGPEPWLLAAVWDHRHDISPYDAPYLVLALHYGVSLVTLDKRLARACVAVNADALVPAET